jgi:hypothetical protein
MDSEEIERRMAESVKKFHQPYARLFPFIGWWVRTPLGEGRLLAVFASAAEVHPSGTNANGKPKDTFRVQPENVEPISER